MLLSPSSLPEKDRAAIVKALNELLASSADLHSMAKVAHWNVRGPTFKALHTLFDEVAGVADEQTDDIAERLVALGGFAEGTVRDAASATPLKPFPSKVNDGERLTRTLLERLTAHVSVMKEADTTADQHGDADTVNMLQEFVVSLEKYGWQLAASLE